MNTRIELSSGRILDIEADFSPAYCGTFEEPGYPAQFEICGVCENDCQAETTEDEQAEIMAALWGKLREAHDNNLAAREEYLDARRRGEY